jgi:hypothetical protein
MENMIKFLGRFLGFKPLEAIEIDLGEEGKKHKNLESLFDAFQKTNGNGMSEKRKRHFPDEDLTNAIYGIQQTLSKMFKRYEADEIQEEKKVKWKYASLVMDRFFLILTIIYFAITFISIIMSIPNFYKPI